jgi:predicted O-methyltransferase YrrM
MPFFLDYARSTPLYRQLCATPATSEGNLLEATDEQTAEAQTEFLRWALNLARPQVILETGTNKGLFGYLMSLVCRDVVLHTFDVHPGAAQAVQTLNSMQSNVSCLFHEGDSRATLRELRIAVQFAWIDGGHVFDVALSDLQQCYRLQVPYIAVDDTSYTCVRQAVNHLLEHTRYREVPHPFLQHDSRKAILLARE